MKKSVLLKKIAALSITGLVVVLVGWLVWQPNAERIVIYGDSRTGHEVHRKVMGAIMKIKPKIVFHVGDLVVSNSRWPIVNEILSELRKSAEFYPALGNHEYMAGEEAYFANFELPNNEQWYSVERMGIHFIVLDSNVSMDKSSEQYRWLESDLKNINAGIKFTIAIFHHPIFNTPMMYRSEDEMGLKSVIAPLFERYGVDAVFTGHNHTYERLLYKNTYYIITGGGGAPLHSLGQRSPYSQKNIKMHHFCVLYLRGDRLYVKVLDSDSNLIDQFKMNK